MGAPAAILPPRTAARACAAAEGGGSARRAFCSEIRLEDGKAPEWVQLFPRGPSLKARDGRLWRLADPEAVARRSEERRGNLDLVIDWEHAQERRAPRGERADAAGWIRSIAARDGLLMARVEWTEEGRKSVESRGYRYISPTFGHTVEIGPRGNLDGGDVTYVAGAGLVNRPAFDMPALAGQQEEQSMLKKILEALGLAADATEAQAVAAVKTLQTERDEAKSQAAAPPIEQFVPRADYDNALARATAAETELASVRGTARDAEIRQALDAAQEAGKITPATRAYHEARCREQGGLEAFREFVSAAPEIAGGTGAGGSPPAGGPVATAAEKAAAKAFGQSVDFVNEHASELPGGDD